MAAQRRNLKIIAALAGLALVAGAAMLLFGVWQREERLPPLGLFTTLPLYWGEGEELGDVLAGQEGRHWARALIEQRRELRPIDVLVQGRGAGGLGNFRDLLLAQPRALAPAENVALDNWVRGGGRLLLLADPLLTGHSDFAIGDPRRPQDVVLLSPILTRWGLRLEFDEAQPLGERMIELAGGEAPVDLPGHFAILPTAPGAPATCQLLSQGIAAQCKIGKGRVLVLADAAVMGADGAGHGGALSRLMAAAYAVN